MTQRVEQPFESIESAYDFLQVLSEAVAEAKQDLQGDVQRESSSGHSRRLDALRIASYSVEKLEFHINYSRRILNDLRSLRRLLFAERGTPKVTVPAKPVEAARLEKPAVPPPMPFPVVGSGVKRGKQGRGVAA